MTDGPTLGPGGKYDLATPIFGPVSTEQREEVLAELIRFNLGADVVSALFRHESIGIVNGYRLSDGQEVVVKVFQPEITTAFLTAVEDIRRHLFSAGLPLAEPIAGPLPCGDGLATIERFVPRSGHPGPAIGSRTESMAQTLAVLLERGADLDSARLTPLDRGGPWRFEFSSDPWDLPKELDFMQPLVTEAQTMFMASETAPTLGHGDWRAPNMAFQDDGRVAAVFDWDSLHRLPEAWTVGVSASIFLSGAEDGLGWISSPEEASSFLTAYRAARSGLMSDEERRSTVGAMLYSMASRAEIQFLEQQEAEENQRPWLIGANYLDAARENWQTYTQLV